MPTCLAVFINERLVTVAAGALVLDGLRVAVPELIDACQRGEALVTDGRGLPAPLDAPLTAGAILRVARSSRRGPADA
jgi:hypothetical protein